MFKKTFFIIFFFARAHCFANTADNNAESLIYDDRPMITNVFFDLDGVLFETDELAAAQHIGAVPILNYLWNTFSFPNKTMLFSFLMQVEAVAKEPSYNNGMLIPPVLVDWIAGLDSHQNIQRKIINYVEASDASFAKKTVIKNLTGMMLHPESFISTRKPLMQGQQLLASVEKLKKKGIKIYIMSNWDEASFKILRKQNRHIFDLCDGTVISGEVKALKPSRSIFEIAENLFGLNKRETLLIDDEEANVVAAQEVGWRSIQYKKENEEILYLLNQRKSKTSFSEEILSPEELKIY